MPPRRALPSVLLKKSNSPQRTLSQMYKLTRKRNLDLKILRERMKQTELIKAKTWVMLKPMLNVQGQYTRNDQEISINFMGGFSGLSALFEAIPESFLTPEQKAQIEEAKKQFSQPSEPTVIQQKDALSFAVSLQWAFLNFRAIPLLKVAYLAGDQMRLSARHIRREMMFAVARTYYGVLLTEGIVKIARQSLTNTLEHLRIARVRKVAGLAPQLTVLRAQIDVAKARKNLVQALNGRRTAKLSMALLLDYPTLRFKPVRPPPPSPPKGKIKDLVRRAYLRRPDLAASRVALQMAQHQRTEVWMRFLPTLALSGLYRGSNAGGFAGDFTAWSVSLTAQMSLYDGGQRYALLRETRSKIRQARLEYRKLKNKINQDIRSAYISLQNAKATLNLARNQLKLAESTYKLTQERYKNGVATPIEVTDANTLITSARISVLRESLNYDIAVLALQRATWDFVPR